MGRIPLCSIIAHRHIVAYQRRGTLVARRSGVGILLRVVPHVRCIRLAHWNLEFDHGIVVTRLRELQEDLPSLPLDLPLLLLYPGTQQAIAAVNVGDASSMHERRHRLNWREVTCGQYPFL